jgi:phosphocarrier protein HPr
LKQVSVTMNEAKRRIEITNRLGLHARPAAEFVKLASRFNSTVFVEKDGLEVNGKSIMGVMMLAAEQGTRLTVRAVGDDAEAAVARLEALVRDGFGEDEAMYAEEAAEEVDPA